MTVAEDTRSCDRFWRDIIDPLVVVFSEIQRCQHPHFTQFFQNAKKGTSSGEVPAVKTNVYGFSSKPSHNCTQGHHFQCPQRHPKYIRAYKLGLRRGGRRDTFAVWGGRQIFPFFPNFYSNFWLIFGKLWETRSRLYRSGILQVNTRWKALAEIFTMHSFALL